MDYSGRGRNPAGLVDEVDKVDEVDIVNSR